MKLVRLSLTSLIFAFTFASFSFLSSTSVNACSCIAPGTPTESLEESQSVFRGIVKDISERTVEFGVMGYEVTFGVEEYWKGDLSSELTIQTAKDSASCGFNFEVGGEYLVYTRMDTEGNESTSLCSRTTDIENAEADLDELGESESTSGIVNQPEVEEEDVDENETSEEEDTLEPEEDLARDEVIIALFALVGLSLVLSVGALIMANKKNM